MYFIFQLLLLIISSIFYFFAPDDYSIIICTVAALFFVLSFIMYLINRKDKNYFTFEIIFSVSYFFVFFMYPVFAKPIGGYKFLYPINDLVINKSTVLASIGYIAFQLGNTAYKIFKQKIKIKQITGHDTYLYIQKGKMLFPLILCCFVLVLTFAQFFIFHANRYEVMENGNSVSGVWSYINKLEHGIIMASISLGFYSLYHQTKKIDTYNIILWILIGGNVLVSFIAGYRAVPMGYIIAIVSGIVIYKGGMSSIKLFFLAFFGFVVLNYIMLMRANNSTNFSFNIFSLGSDLITNNYTLYKGYDYVKNNGNVVFPFFGPLITAIPFLLGRIMNIFNLQSYYSSTASFLTYDTIGNLKLGMGSNVIISIYLSLGFIGVLFFMYILGRFIRYLSEDIKNSGMYKLLLYFEMMAVSVYLVRGDYFYSVSHMVWGCLILLIFQKTSFVKTNRIERE